MGLKPTTKTVLSINDKNEKKSRSHYETMLTEAGLPITDENVFIAAACGDKGITFLLGKAKVGVRYKEKQTPCAPKQDSYKITVSGETFDVKLNGNTATVNGVDYTVSMDNNTAQQPAQPTVQTSGTAQIITAGTPGVITQVLVKQGDAISVGQTLCVIEVMKMETEVKSAVAGTITTIFATKGEQVVAGQKLFEVK